LAEEDSDDGLESAGFEDGGGLSAVFEGDVEQWAFSQVTEERWEAGTGENDIAPEDGCEHSGDVSIEGFGIGILPWWFGDNGAEESFGHEEFDCGGECILHEEEAALHLNIVFDVGFETAGIDGDFVVANFGDEFTESLEASTDDGQPVAEGIFF